MKQRLLPWASTQGKFLWWVDECGRAIRYSRLELEDASDIANVSNPMLNKHSCWANAQIGQSYEWGAPLGPPHGENGEDTSE